MERKRLSNQGGFHTYYAPPQQAPNTNNTATTS